MFWRILKKDLKRKRTMNIILLLFVIICSMFAAASINNIIAVTGGIDHFFDISDVTDVALSMPAESDLDDRIRELPGVSEVRTEKYIMVTSSKNFSRDGVKLDNFINPAFFISDDNMGTKYFDEDNNVITDVEKGCFYANSPFLFNLDIKEGDVFDVNIDGKTVPLRYSGRFKGALLSHESFANPFLIIDSEDYNYLDQDENTDFNGLLSMTVYVNTEDVDAVRELIKDSESVSLSTREEMKDNYLFDILAAYLLMAISVILMFTGFVVLRFTIGFTISEEFREIGVMKAVGIDNRSIRGMYIVKYLAISVVGAAIGFICSLPLTDAMMKTVSENAVLDDNNSRFMGIFSSVLVVAVILLFCYFCTRRVKKLSPIDAVRSGQTGERFRRKSILHLGRSKLPSTGFMALNDVLSAPKRFSIITLIFTLCMLLMMLMSNFALTLRSEKILWVFTVPECDAIIADVEYFKELYEDPMKYRELLDDSEKMLEENGIPGKCSTAIGARGETAYKDKKANVGYWIIKGRDDYRQRMNEGSAPQKTDEIAMTGKAMDSIGAGIGDRVRTVIGDKEYEFLITGRYSTFEYNGYCALLHSDFEFAPTRVNSTMGLQIDFDGDTDEETVARNIEMLKDIIDSDKVYTPSEMINSATGMSDTLSAIKKLMMILTVVVTSLIVILMERSFISKEKSEIALMKAVGVSNGSLILQHVLRFVITAVLACIVSTAVMMPLSDLLMNWVCSMIGDVSGMKCAFDPLEIFLICPAILIGVTVIGSALTALYMKTIKASDTASIE